MDNHQLEADLVLADLDLAVEAELQVSAGQLLTEELGFNPSDVAASVSQARYLPPRAVKILKRFVDENPEWEYPSKQQKALLALDCEISEAQVSTWFSNRRQRQAKMNAPTAKKRSQ